MYFLALRYLYSRKRQTLLALCGIIMGTMAYIVLSGLMTGFAEYIEDRLVGLDAHIRISAPESKSAEIEKKFHPEALHVFWASTPPKQVAPGINYPQKWYHFLAKDPLVLAYTPQLFVNAIWKKSGTQKNIRLVGIDPERQALVTHIADYVVSGKLETLTWGGNRILIGIGLMRQMEAQLGDIIILNNQARKSYPFKIAGIFETGVSSLDDSTVYALLSDVQKVNETENRISDIAVRLKQVTLASKLGNQWSRLFPEKIRIWERENAATLAVYKLQNVTSSLMVLAILSIVGFGIYNNLSMMVQNKKQDIAILRSIGFEPKEIIRLFLYQGFILGGLGSILGMILGYVACLYLQTLHIEALKVSSHGHILISFVWAIYIKAFLIPLGMALLSCILPAYAAGRLSPLEVMRGQ